MAGPSGGGFDAEETLPADVPAASPTHEARADRPLRLERGSEVGRYVVLHKLGAGGMGVVYAAYDPELDRKVALKLLHAGDASMQSSSGRSRLVREAQAMAKLDHPNVVTVHDVGEHEGAVYVAMEFVEGGTLADWLERERRSWQDVVETMTLAGRGLEAAHAAGLVHRDFKPENVMVGRDGRVRVMDFGLVRAEGSAELETEVTGADSPEDLEFQPSSRASALDSKLTVEGGVMGTPAYMAPEQFAGEKTDARTDQFSFCVTLWEALYGERPFPGDNMAALSFALSEGRLREPKVRTVPGWLRALCERGLAVDPQRRHESMSALLAALSSDRRRAGRRRLAVPVVLLGAVFGGAIGYQRLDESNRRAACAAEAQALRTSWTESRREQVRASLEAVDVPYASTTAEKTLAWLDRKNEELADAHQEACEKAEVSRVWSSEEVERANWCLAQREIGFDAHVAVLSDADKGALNGATPGAAALESPAPCTDPASLARDTPPIEIREELRHQVEELARSRSLKRADRKQEAARVAEEVLAASEALEWPPLRARVKFRLGITHDALGDYEEAERFLEEAYFEASRAGAPETAHAAASHLTYVVGYRLARVDEGLRWASHAELVADSVGTLSELQHATRLNNEAAVYNAARDLERGRALNEEVLEVRERVLGPEHPQVGLTLVNLASSYARAGKTDKAVEYSKRAIQITETALGEEHPDVGKGLLNLASTYFLMGDYAAAQPVFERALRITEGAEGPDHPQVAMALNNLAAAYQAENKIAEATPLFERALEIREAHYPADHPYIGTSLGNLAIVKANLGEHGAALDLLTRALAIREKNVEPMHESLLPLLVNISAAEFEVGKLEESLAHAQRGYDIGQKHEETGEALAETQYALARPLWATGGANEKARAVELGEAALVYFASDEGNPESAAEVEAWVEPKR